MSDLISGGFAIEGTVVAVNAEEKISEKLTKRTLWLEAFGDSDYPQIIEIEFINDKTSIIGKYSAGNNVVVDINLRGRQVTMADNSQRVFNSLNGWRIKGDAAGGSNSDPVQAPDSPVNDTADDLPF